MHKYTEEELKKAAELYKKYPGKTCAEMMGVSFNSFKAMVKNHNILSGRDGRFQKGYDPPNKGKTISKENYDLIKPTMFKKGHRPSNSLPVGSETINSTGYVVVKVAEPNVWGFKHRLVYEEAYGPLKPSEVVYILNGDKTDLRPDNLIKVTRSELARINQFHLHSDDTDIGRAKVYLAKIKAAQGRSKDEH